jgi:hypothetical protein
MSWVKLSTSILTDPDLGALTDAAFRAYIRTLAYCGEHLTDGAVSQKAIRTLFIGDDVATELVTEGLWLVTDDGYEVRNYLNYQQSREQVESSREADRVRKTEARRAAAEKRAAKASAAESDQVSGRTPDGLSPESAQSPLAEEKRSEEKRSEENNQLARPAAERVPASDFAEWWASYPRKVGKSKAERSYTAARKRGVTREQLEHGLAASMDQWRRERRPPDKIPHPTTWLNEGRWEDDYSPASLTSLNDHRRPMTPDEELAQLKTMVGGFDG